MKMTMTPFERNGDYLHKLNQGQVLNTSVLSLLRLDIAQLVYAHLKDKEIEAHKLYTGRTGDQLFMQSLNSIEDMQKYIGYLVSTAAEYRHFAEEPKSVAQEIKHYIHTHCGDDLSRMSLAETVYLNPTIWQGSSKGNGYFARQLYHPNPDCCGQASA